MEVRAHAGGGGRGAGAGAGRAYATIKQEPCRFTRFFIGIVRQLFFGAICRAHGGDKVFKGRRFTQLVNPL